MKRDHESFRFIGDHEKRMEYTRKLVMGGAAESRGKKAGKLQGRKV